MMEGDEIYIKIPIRVHKMLSMDGYMSSFWLYVQQGKTHPEAFYACERDLDKYGIPARYTSYESFKVAKSRREARDGEGFDISFV